MAQIIKHRRGGIGTLKDVTARVGEFVMATGSIANLNGPMVFIGESEGVAGAYRPVSKIYQGSSAPTIDVGAYGSVIDGTPFYATSNKTLYILSKDGNSNINLTGNIEGNTISGLTINKLTGALGLDGNLNMTGNTYQTGSIFLTGDVTLRGNINIGDNLTGDTININGEVSSSIIPAENNSFDLGSSTNAWKDLYVSGTAYISTLDLGSITLNSLALPGNLTVSGTTILSGSVLVEDLTEKRLVVAGTNGLLTNYSGLTFDNGNLNVSGAIEVTNIQGTGSLYLKPDLNDSRDFRIYNTAPSDIHIKGNAAYSFFGDDTNFLKIDDNTSTITIDSLSGVTVNTTLDIKGDTTLTGSLFATKIEGTGSLYLQPNQSDGRYFEIYNTAAADTHIKSNQGLSFFGDDTNYLLVNDGAQTVTIVGVNGVAISSSLSVTGSATFTNNVNVSGNTTTIGSQFINTNLFVGGDGKVTGSFEAVGATSLDNTLTVSGSSTLKSTLEVQGATGLNSTLDVTGSATLKSTLQVDSTSQLKGAVGMNSTLDVTGSAQFKSTINVDGEATLSSATVEDLTQDRIVTVGAGGSLIDSSGFTYNGTVLKIGNGQFEVDTNDGDVRTSGSITTNGLTNNGNLTVNGVLTVTGNTQLNANLYVSGNLEVLGGATSVTIQSTTIELDDNIIRLNAYSPFERYAGFEVIDSGSTGVSASLVWDGLNDYWMFVSSSGQSSKLLGTTAGTYGSETSLTATYFPIATGQNTIGDSLLRYSGTTLSFNTNKFTIDSGTGDTLVSGNFTLSYSGGTDNGNNTSAITFRNSSNVVGFVSTTETTDVLDGILGYKSSDGALVFSTVIDGGGY